jgi:esterase/lipase superfamily enzyme
MALDTLDELHALNAGGHIHIYTCSGDYEDPEANRRFSQVLNEKGIRHELDVWGPDITHDWPTWRKMLPYILDAKF